MAKEGGAVLWSGSLQENPYAIDQMAQTWVQWNWKVLGGTLWGDLVCLGHCIGGGRL